MFWNRTGLRYGKLLLRIKNNKVEELKPKEENMEEQLAALIEQVAALKLKVDTTNTMFAETYYYLTIPLMIIIHAGFLAYEMGSSRTKDVLTSGVKNILAFAFIIPTFYFFGWWIYWGFPTGLDPGESHEFHVPIISARKSSSHAAM